MGFFHSNVVHIHVLLNSNLHQLSFLFLLGWLHSLSTNWRGEPTLYLSHPSIFVCLAVCCNESPPRVWSVIILTAAWYPCSPLNSRAHSWVEWLPLHSVQGAEMSTHYSVCPCFCPSAVCSRSAPLRNACSWNLLELCVQILEKGGPYSLVILPQFGGYWIEDPESVGTPSSADSSFYEEEDGGLSPGTFGYKLECNGTARAYRKHFLGKVSHCLASRASPCWVTWSGCSWW